MSFSKKTREAVYSKYGGRCAYCGCKIKITDMQIDHFIAKRGWAGEGSDDLANLMPACRMCNHYKRANTLETFRAYIAEIPQKLRKNYIYKVGVAYGNVIENEKPIEFYFETVRGDYHENHRGGLRPALQRRRTPADAGSGYDGAQDVPGGGAGGV